MEICLYMPRWRCRRTYAHLAMPLNRSIITLAIPFLVVEKGNKNNPAKSMNNAHKSSKTTKHVKRGSMKSTFSTLENLC